MTETMYRKLLTQFQALTPMCHFEVPEILCTDEELYYRRLHKRVDEGMTDLVNLAVEEVNA